jgi:hypothetical protein
VVAADRAAAAAAVYREQPVLAVSINGHSRGEKLGMPPLFCLLLAQSVFGRCLLGAQLLRGQDFLRAQLLLKNLRGLHRHVEFPASHLFRRYNFQKMALLGSTFTQSRWVRLFRMV